MSLDPCWTVAQVKTTLAPKLNTPTQDLRIIFAGKELPDDLVIQQCDLGNHSFLHAVRVVAGDKTIGAKTSSVASSSLIHVNETLHNSEAIKVLLLLGIIDCVIISKLVV